MVIDAKKCPVLGLQADGRLEQIRGGVGAETIRLEKTVFHGAHGGAACREIKLSREMILQN